MGQVKDDRIAFDPIDHFIAAEPSAVAVMDMPFGADVEAVSAVGLMIIVEQGFLSILELERYHIVFFIQGIRPYLFISHIDDLISEQIICTVLIQVKDAEIVDFHLAAILSGHAGIRFLSVALVLFQKCQIRAILFAGGRIGGRFRILVVVNIRIILRGPGFHFHTGQAVFRKIRMGVFRLFRGALFLISFLFERPGLHPRHKDAACRQQDGRGSSKNFRTLFHNVFPLHCNEVIFGEPEFCVQQFSLAELQFRLSSFSLADLQFRLSSFSLADLQFRLQQIISILSPVLHAGDLPDHFSSKCQSSEVSYSKGRGSHRPSPVSIYHWSSE